MCLVFEAPGSVRILGVLLIFFFVQPSVSQSQNPTDSAGASCGELDRKTHHGKVVWFNREEGYGFVEPESGGGQIFLHISALERIGLTSVRAGSIVSFIPVSTRDGRTTADVLRVSPSRCPTNTPKGFLGQAIQKLLGSK